MRDFMTRGGAISADHLNELHAAADDLAAAPAEPAGGGPACQTHAGSGEGRAAWAPCPPCSRDYGVMEPVGGRHGGGTHSATVTASNAAHGAARGLPAHVTMVPDRADAVMLAVASHFAALLDWSVAEAAKAGPMPMVSGEPWMEGDDAYRERLNRRKPQSIATSDACLDHAGEVLGLPRARLVPVETRP